MPFPLFFCAAQRRGALCLLAWTLLIAPASTAETEPAVSEDPPATQITVTGGPTAVLIYSNQARVTRQQSVEVPAGEVLLEWRGLPAAVQPASLRAALSGIDGLRLRRVRYDLIPVRPEIPQDRAELAAKRTELELQQRELQDARTLATTYLELLEQISTPETKQPTEQTARTDLPLVPAGWAAALEFIQSESQKTLDHLRSLNTRTEAVNTELAAVIRSLEKLSVDQVPAVTAAVIECHAPAAGTLQVELSYLVDQVAWYPTYSVTVDAAKEHLELVRGAWVGQHTGEDWTDVAMTLSTGSPMRLASLPTLQTWTIGNGSANRIEPQHAGNNWAQATSIVRPEALAAARAHSTNNPLARSNEIHLANVFGYRGQGSVDGLPFEEVQTESAGNAAFMALGAGGGATGLFGNRSGGGRLRAVGRYGGSRASENVVHSGLDWLAEQQHNGRWGEGASSLADSALAITAFLGAGYDHHTPSKWKNLVASGLVHLRRSVTTDDLRQADLWTLAQVSTALAEAYALTLDDELRQPASRAIAELERRLTAVPWQLNPAFTRRSWPDGPHNLAFAALAFKSAASAGLPVDSRTWLQLLPMVNQIEQASTHPLDLAATAMTRILLGFQSSDAHLQQAVDRLLATRPDLQPGAFDHRQLMLATLVLFQTGGEPWKQWNQTVSPRIAEGFDHQGAFAPIGRDGLQGGGKGSTIYATALMTLSLQAYYRYTPVNAESGRIPDHTAEVSADIHYQSPVISAGGRDDRFTALQKSTLVSNGAYKSVALERLALPTSFEHHAVPLAHSGAWLRASAINSSQRSLLAGEARLYDGTEFIGSVFLESVDPGERFVVPLGLDPGVTLNRTRTTATQHIGFRGQTTRTTFSVRITAHNSHDRPINLVIRDRIPRPADNRIRIENVDFGERDPVYDPDSQSGEVRFATEVAARNSAALSINYAIEHPVDIQVVQEQQ